MKTYRAMVKRTIDASVETVYRVVSDMEEHRKILPKEFESFEVVQGGKGAGTVFKIVMNVLGTKTSNVMTITEPEPGRVMKEEDAAAGLVTLWTLDPLEGGRRCELKLESTFRSKPGFAGFIERLLGPVVVRSIYRREMELLQAYVTKG
ncbi:SRPBCC family protein [Brevibacillus sp. B_LB10_24]|uniref:SRPBCC family protein n=1 Tax=Brevibacillus sp. B_LB10_24 TaxID=3380645 RepID=UPI0038B8A45E